MRPNGAVPVLSVLGLAALLSVTGCDDRLGPEHWSAIPDTVELYSWDRPEYQGFSAGFDMVGRQLDQPHGQPVAVDNPGSSGNWDFALRERDGQLFLMPAGVMKNLDLGSGIAHRPNESFESLTKIPGNPEVYTFSEFVEIEEGEVYALRSRRFYGGFSGQSCFLYGKLRPISLDQTEGILRFEIITNPNCNDRSMIPPKKK